MASMRRFFDYPEHLGTYFREVDIRFSQKNVPQPASADLNPKIVDLSDIRAVFWDVYGTLFGVSLGDLERTLEYTDRLTQAADTVIEEFRLATSLNRLYPDQSANIALRDQYLQRIADSHERSRTAGIEFPEVVIENIWQSILDQCRQVGYQTGFDEPIRDTAYRIAYCFDASIQHNYLYPGIDRCLTRLSQTNRTQGIISNAQFYTPIQLRRVLRKELQRDNLELEEFFDESLVFFSYELGYSKPNPGAFQKANRILGRQGIEPEQIAYIGNDMLNDIWAAAQAGWKTILFAADKTQTTLRENQPKCGALEADAIVTQAESLIEMFISPHTNP